MFRNCHSASCKTIYFDFSDQLRIRYQLQSITHKFKIIIQSREDRKGVGVRKNYEISQKGISVGWELSKSSPRITRGERRVKNCLKTCRD